jgi:hypothetical protein
LPICRCRGQTSFYSETIGKPRTQKGFIACHLTAS